MSTHLHSHMVNFALPLTLLVGRQERDLACKNLGIGLLVVTI